MRSALGCWEAWLRINEGCRSWTMLHAHSAPVRCLLGFIFRKFTFAISSPDEFLSISQSNAEELDRRAGKTKHCLISYFLSNASAKNYRNRIVYGQIYRKWKVWRFSETQCRTQCLNGDFRQFQGAIAFSESVYMDS